MTDTVEVTDAGVAQATSVQTTRRAKLDDFFAGSRYEVIKTIHLDNGQKFVTPFGNKGRNGFALQEVGGQERKLIVGASLLAKIARDYGAVEVPAKTGRKRRTKAQMAADRAAAPPQRTRKEKLDALFEGAHYEVLKAIHLDGDQRFVTPLGNKGRNGFALKETGVEPGTERKFIIGASLLAKVAAEYGAVEVPAKKRTRRTKAQMAADRAAKAAEFEAQQAAILAE
jgi:hypothetical protein